jgi:16S rRNA (guanine527-N7)-methyltransferase
VSSIYFDERLPVVLELGFAESSVSSLKKYVELLWAANAELNLFSRQMKYEELIDNHVIDCLLPLKQFPKNIKVAADFGAGGGLPGVIYAIQFPNTKYIVFEKSPKKREFLEQCKAVAPNLVVQAEIPSDPKSVEPIFLT